MPAEPVRHIAVDIGASGGRVAVGAFRPDGLDVRIVHRFRNGPVESAGGWAWDFERIWEEILVGLQKASETGACRSVGVNTWGVDFGLVDSRGNLTALSCYRDTGHAVGVNRNLARVGRDELYAETGIQFMEINSVHQLAAMIVRNPEAVERAELFLMVPDLIHHRLCGVMVNEITDAGTTQLIDPNSRTWNLGLMERLGIPARLFGEIAEPGRVLGPVLPEIEARTGLKGCQVVLPPSHDTASAVAACPAEGDSGWAFIASGTWFLVGRERSGPVLSPAADEARLSNEIGRLGTTRLLTNVTGLWIIQECMRAWGDSDYASLYAAAESESVPPVPVDDPSLAAPGTDMPDRVRRLVPEADSPAKIARAVLEGLAVRSTQVLNSLQRVTGEAIDRVHLVGGAAQIPLAARLLAHASGRRILAGPVEATLLGNLHVQAEAMGTIPGGDLRARIARDHAPVVHLP
ncbi:MAG: hypothetical protein MH204_08060 [Fimbriimonadaceae bacterium]|nr:hypothetical protein [Fimbriimonadaceae bacterium]